jgi:K+-sensing histidine kinase KdpD
VTRPVDAALTELERRRRGRWVVVGMLVLAAFAAVALATLDTAAIETLPLAIAVLAVVTLAYGIWVLVEERRARRVVRALIAERERASALSARIGAMETLHLVTRDLSASGELVEVFERLLTGARELTGATSGFVGLLAGEAAGGAVTVAAADGEGAPSRGTVLPVDGGLAHQAVERGSAVVAGQGAPSGDQDGPSRIAAPLRLPDRSVGVLVVARDPGAPPVTDAEVAVVELFAQHAALAVRNAWRLDEHRATADELRRTAAARAEVLAGIVHDLRAPLTAAGGFVAVLREQEAALTPERRASLLDDASRELRRLAGIVEELLAVAAAEAGALRRSEVVDVAALVRDVSQVARGLRAAKRAGAQRAGPVTVTAPGPAMVRGDAVALQRVMANLLDNAVQHTPDGTAIEVEVDRLDDEVVIRVRDHGPGTDERTLARAFDVFATDDDPDEDTGTRGDGALGTEAAAGTGTATERRADRSTAVQLAARRRRGPGRGVGLHVVRTLVEAHGGSVTLRSVEPDEGTGTRAEVRLPSAPPDAASRDGQLGR